MNVSKAKNIFFVGIGGIGVSGLARILKSKGVTVSGSDSTKSEITDELAQEGIKVHEKHEAKNIDGADLLIYSTAVPETNAERIRAKSLGLPDFSYPEALGQVANDYFLITVSGTNGKTTTTAMIASVMITAGLDPTVLVGSKLAESNSNARIGKSKFFILEADEYRRAFLNYKPDLAVITNIAADHLDYFKNETDVKSAFAEFIQNVKLDGSVVFNMDDKNIAEVVKSSTLKSKIGFGRSSLGELEDLSLQVPGEYNRLNAIAAFKACEVLGIDKHKILEGLKAYKSAWRRYERVGELGGAEIISDYAHHPDGVKALLKGVTEENKKTLVVYQPHQHNRTKTPAPTIRISS